MLKEQLFSFYGIIFIIFLIWIIYLVATDNRFDTNRKYLFFFIVVGLILIGYFLDKMPYLIIKDLFWYSLILNGSFIFHVLILDRIFHWCWKKHYEYLGFIVSRISFTLSFSAIICFLRDYLWEIFSYLPSSYEHFKFILRLHKNDTYEYKNTFRYKQAYFFVNYMKYIPFPYFFFFIIDKIIYFFMKSVLIILIYFSTIFHNYSLFLLGKNNKIDKNVILKQFILFMIFFIISIIIGTPRLYIIWLFQILIEFYKIFNYEYYNANRRIEFQGLNNIIEKIKYHYDNYDKTPYWYLWYEGKYKELIKIYEKPYHPFFNFDLYKFLNNKYQDGEWSWVWGAEDTPYADFSESKMEFPITKIYKFYPWEDMAIGYCRSRDLAYKDDFLEPGQKLERNRTERLVDGLFWCKLIGRDHRLLLKIMPDIIFEEDIPIKEDFLKLLENEDNIYYYRVWLRSY